MGVFPRGLAGLALGVTESSGRGGPGAEGRLPQNSPLDAFFGRGVIVWSRDGPRGGAVFLWGPVLRVMERVMPVYEYECTKCEHRFEQLRKVTDPPPTRCPHCRSKVKRVFGRPHSIFKGSGFHVTDYGEHGAKASEPAAAPAASSTSSDSGSSGD